MNQRAYGKWALLLIAGQTYQAAMRGDRATAARHISYPLTVRYPMSGKLKNFRTAAELLSAWDSVFTPPMLEVLRTGLPHDMFVHDGMASLANGAAWFDKTGLKFLNVSAPVGKETTE